MPHRLSSALALLAGAVLLAVSAPSAFAAFSVDAPPLTQPAGERACVSTPGDAISPCRAVEGLRTPGAIVASPRGRDVYAASARDDRIVRLTVGRRTHALRVAGCTGAADRCRQAPSLHRVKALAISGDGRWLAAVSPRSRALTLLRRSRSGRLTATHCLAARPVAERGTASCDRAPSLRGARAVAIAPEGESVYVTLGRRAAVVGFRRHGRKLAPMTGAGSCVVDAGRAGGRGLRDCRVTSPLGGASAIAATPDGRGVLVVARSDDAVVSLRRSPADGTLRPVACVSDSGAGWCAPAAALDDPTTVAVSPEGANVYVGSAAERSVSAFSRDLSGALTQIGCYGSGPFLIRDGLCVLVPQLVAPSSIAVTPSGRWVGVTDPVGSTVSGFRREFGGDLTPIVPPNGCIGPFGGGCLVGRGLAGATQVAAVDDRTLVVTAQRGAAVVRLPR